jgi:hypothetical protein
MPAFVGMTEVFRNNILFFNDIFVGGGLHGGRNSPSFYWIATPPKRAAHYDRLGGEGWATRGWARESCI